MISVPHLIEKQPRWSIVVRDQKIGIAIVINITERSTTPNFQQRKLRLIDDLNKTPFPRIAKQLIRLAQRKRILLPHQLRQQLHCAIRDEQIEPPIVVVIKEERAETREATTGHPEPRFTRAI